MNSCKKSVISFAICLIAFIGTINAHCYFSSITVDSTVYKEGDCMRPHPDSQYDYPISQLQRTNGLTSADMTCGWLPSASKAANKKCPVNPGSTVTLQWHYEMGLGAADTFFIDPSHKGPCIVYMAKSETGSGPVWFKIFEDGYDTVSKTFCVTRMRQNGGKFSVKIPTDIAPGNYLLRGELIALHEGDQLYGAQPYVGCAEVTVGGSGTVNPAGVAIPGAYTANDAGIHFDIYSGKITSYPIPGPKLYVSGSTSSVATNTTGSQSGSGSSSTTAKAAGSTTAKAATTGKRAGSSSSSSSSTTGAAAPVGSGSSGSSTPCVLGNMKCTSSETFSTCYPQQGGVLGWGANQRCNTGLTCHPTGNYVYCY